MNQLCIIEYSDILLYEFNAIIDRVLIEIPLFTPTTC